MSALGLCKQCRGDLCVTQRMVDTPERNGAGLPIKKLVPMVACDACGLPDPEHPFLKEEAARVAAAQKVVQRDPVYEENTATWMERLIRLEAKQKDLERQLADLKKNFGQGRQKGAA